MPLPILATKLHIPTPRPKIVLRPRLIERLNAGLHSKLMLISAPAGFGKTTLLSEWIASHPYPVAWLSLDEDDSDPTRFLTYLVTAIQKIMPHLGTGLLGVLQSPQQPPINALLTMLLNEMDTLPTDFVFVLDDYHVLESPVIDDALAFLLKHLPPRMHLVIATREDPQLPLALLRVQGQLTELRITNLRFTLEETTDFLNQGMGLNLSVQDVAALETRTEGWIAGLQLAALSMQGRADARRFIQAFAGSHRFVLDYLVTEVLQRQPDSVRRFLLQTSILDRLCGALCAAVTEQEDSREMLDMLERGNMFIVPLDDQRQWYRYHHLFADVLQARLLEEQPQQVFIQHQRASLWFEQNGQPSDAVRHALAGKDFARAARLIELAWMTLRKTRQEATLLVWMKSLPDEWFSVRPVLSVGYAWALLDGGELAAAEARLQDAERWLSGQAALPSAAMIVEDVQQFQSLPASIANARAYQAQARGDMAGTVFYTRQALDLMPEDDYYERGTAAALLGLAYWADGNLEAAYHYFADGLASLLKGGGTLIMIGGSVILAHIKIAQGHLREALRIHEQSLQLATTQGTSPLHGTAELYLGLSEIYFEQGHYETARQSLLKGMALREQASLPGYEYLWCIVQARLKELDGDIDAALNLLEEAARVYYRSPIPDIRPVAALQARLWIAHGRLDEAQKWRQQQNRSTTDELRYLHEFEHLTLARLFIAQYQHDSLNAPIQPTVELLERLLDAAEVGKRTKSIIEILTLQALIYQAQGNITAALAQLQRALILAEPEHYVQIFVAEGLPMTHLLHEAVLHEILPEYTAELLSILTASEPTSQSSSHPIPALVEPLTERELDVLRLLGTDLDGPEIARELVIALSTVRTHTKSIYSKLNVTNRLAAIKRAQELELI